MTRLGDLQVEGSERGRSTWLYQYTSAELAKAAEKVATYHDEREKFYAAQAAEIEAQIRDKGVSLEEQSVTGGPRFTAKVDPDLGQQLGLSRQKRDGHRRDKDIFWAYVGAFSKSNMTFHLTIADVDYFCLHREPGE